MSEDSKQSVMRSATVIQGLSPENQSAIAKNLATLIDVAMDAAEQIAPMLAENQPG